MDGLAGAVLAQAFLREVALASAVVVPHLVDGVATPFASSLAEVERCHIGGAVGEEGVAQDEHLVDLVVAASGEACAEGLFPFVPTLDGRHRCRTGLHPNELPVVVEVV